MTCGDSFSMLDSFSSVLQFVSSRDQSTCSVRVYPPLEFAHRDEAPTTPSDYPQLMGDMLVEEVDANPECCSRLGLRQRKPPNGPRRICGSRGSSERVDSHLVP